MNYPESTQRESWLFTGIALDECRQHVRNLSLDALRQAVAAGDGSEGPPPTLDPVSLEEELLLLKYYGTKLQLMCRELRFPKKVLGSAVTFFKRFYLNTSALDYDPQHIVLTCLYLACKVEDCYISAAELGRLSRTSADAILRHEVEVLQGLKFDLVAYAPYKAIDGLVEDISTWRASGGEAAGGLADLTDEQLQKAKAAAYAAADALILTDATLLFTPGQLGLAAIRNGFLKIGLKLDGYLGHAVQRAASLPSSGGALEEQVQQLRLVLDRIDGLGVEGAASVAQDQVSSIDRRLKACRNPLDDPSSEASRAAAAVKAKVKAEKKAKKSKKQALDRAALEEEVGILPDGGAKKAKVDACSSVY